MANNTRGPGPGPRGRGGKKAKDAKGTFLRLMRILLKENKLKLLIVLVCIAISSAAGAASSVFLKTLFDDYVSPLLEDTVNADFSGLAGALMWMAVFYVAGIIASFTYNRLMITVSQGVMLDIRQKLFSHMQDLPIRYFDSHTHGDIMSKFTNDTDTLRQLIGQSIPSLASTAATVAVVFTSMIVMSWQLTLIVVAFLVMKFTVVNKIGGRSGSYFVKQQVSLGALNGFAEEMLNGQKVVKVFNHEEAARTGFDRLNDELCHNATRANTYANILMPIMANLGHLMYVTCAIAGGAIAIAHPDALSIGSIVAFLQLTRNFNMPINQASQQINSVVMALAGAERVFELMDEPVETDGGDVHLVNVYEDSDGTFTESRTPTGHWAWKLPDDEDPYIPVRGHVELRNVDFAYEEGHPVLHDISLYAKPSQKLAFVGATGAGKTTITNLINRFYDIQAGSVKYDGIDIARICKKDLRHSLGVVLQDVNLFTGTVMENIRYGNLAATDEECIAAAKRANAHDFISRLPQGYDTLLSGDGSGLSQGQCQLISIARAAVADPPVMILDEATSSIDTRTERLVQRGMDQLMKGRTVFVIAHRLSTVMDANAIIVLEHGRIIERGTHDYLISQRGTYFQLYTGAFELE